MHAQNRAVMLLSSLALVGAAHAQYGQLGDPLQMGINNWGASNYGNSARLASERKHALGRERIKAKRASNLFVPRPFPLELWFKKWNVENDSAGQKRERDEWVVQKALLDHELASRGARGDDMGDLVATLFAMAYEAQSGQKANASQYRHLAADFRASFLANEYFQGEPNWEKVDLAEGQILNATNALRLRRVYQKTGDLDALAQARKHGEDFIGGWWTGGFANLKVTPTGFR